MNCLGEFFIGVAAVVSHVHLYQTFGHNGIRDPHRCAISSISPSALHFDENCQKDLYRYHNWGIPLNTALLVRIQHGTRIRSSIALRGVQRAHHSRSTFGYYWGSQVSHVLLL